MATVMMGAVMSVDGFIADEKGGVGPLFEWYNNGDIEMYGTDPDRPFHISQASYEFVKPLWDQCRVVVIGRRLFDLTNGWHGVPPVGEAVIVVTHQPPKDWDFPDAPFTFVDSVPEAIERASAIAGDGIVSVNGGDVGSQVLAAGLVDEIQIDQAPVVFGSGVRFFGDKPLDQVILDDPEIVPGDRVVHLRYRVRR